MRSVYVYDSSSQRTLIEHGMPRAPTKRWLWKSHYSRYVDVYPLSEDGTRWEYGSRTEYPNTIEDEAIDADFLDGLVKKADTIKVTELEEIPIVGKVDQWFHDFQTLLHVPLFAASMRAVVYEAVGVDMYTGTRGADEDALLTEWAKKKRDDGWDAEEVVAWYLQSKARYLTLQYGSMRGVEAVLSENADKAAEANPNKYTMSEEAHQQYRPNPDESLRKRQRKEALYYLRSDDELRAQRGESIDETKREIAWAALLYVQPGMEERDPKANQALASALQFKAIAKHVHPKYGQAEWKPGKDCEDNAPPPQWIVGMTAEIPHFTRLLFWTAYEVARRNRDDSTLFGYDLQAYENLPQEYNNNQVQWYVCFQDKHFGAYRGVRITTQEVDKIIYGYVRTTGETKLARDEETWETARDDWIKSMPAFPRKLRQFRAHETLGDFGAALEVVRLGICHAMQEAAEAAQRAA